MKTLPTIIHTYNFDVSKPDDSAAYDALRTKLKAMGLTCFETHGGNSHYLGASVDALKIELETACLFDNQWNTGANGALPNHRVFDWAQDSRYACYSPNIKKGHWIEQTKAMKEARAKTYKCGYCGAHYGPYHKPLPDDMACNACLDSEYLTVKDLPLLRLVAVSAKRDDKHGAGIIGLLMPRYKQAQLHGSTERGKKRIAEKRERIEKDYKAAIHKAETEYKGFTWLMDNGINTDNVIYYSHTNLFCFGWRGNGIDKELESDLLDVISEFPFAYEIKCEDGRKLSAT